MEPEMQALLERGVTALEQLAQDPVIDIEVAPARCPHCTVANPLVRVEEKAAQGNLAGFVIQCHCLHCNEVFYAVPMQFQCLKTIIEVEQVQQERAEIADGING